MKALIFLLVLVNLLFYAFSAGLLGRSGSTDAVRVEQQINPENIRIVANGDKPPPRTPEAPAKTQPITLPTTQPSAEADEAPAPAAAPAPTPSQPAAAAPATICLSWSALAQVEADRISRVVNRGFSEFKLQQVGKNTEPSTWWVHIPPLADRAAADRKAAELRALGVTEYFIVQDGTARNAISLGVFTSEKGAREHLSQLMTRGVRSARLTTRPDKDGNVRIEVRGPADSRDALLAAVLKAVPKNKPQDCP